MGLGKIPGLPAGVSGSECTGEGGSQIPALGGTPEKRYETCQKIGTGVSGNEQVGIVAKEATHQPSVRKSLLLALINITIRECRLNDWKHQQSPKKKN